MSVFCFQLYKGLIHWFTDFKKFYRSISMAYQLPQEDNQVVSDHLLHSELFTADLLQADLPQADPLQVNLPQADLPRADLPQADLQ